MEYKMEYQVKTLRLRQRFEEIERIDQELTANLNAFANKGYQLDKIIPDERYVPSGDGKKVYLMIFKK